MSDETKHQLKFGDFVFDAEKLELRRNGSIVQVGETPLKILRLLTESPGKIVEREVLVGGRRKNCD